MKITEKTTIRPYVEKDEIDCLLAFKSNVPQYFTEGEVLDFQAFLKNDIQPTSKAYTGGICQYFVILFQQKIVGCGGFSDRYNNQNITLTWGLIHKDFHKMGLGKALLLYRLNEIKRIFPGLPVSIDTTQFSYPFFEKFGFNTTKITLDYYTKGLDRYDMVHPA